MEALVYEGPQKIIFQEVTEPEEKAGDQLIKIDAVGICGSDMHAFFGHDERRPAPLILGHEASGTVIEGTMVGKQVAINPLVSCGSCSFCMEGRANLCQSREIISMPPRQGAFAEYLRMPARNLIALETSHDPSIIALTEPVATGLHGVYLAHKAAHRPLSEGMHLVVGGGAVGLSAALTLASYGAKNILLADTSAGRRKTAYQTGICEVIDPIQQAHLIAQNNFATVIDAVGTVDTRKLAIQSVTAGGVIVHIGLAQSGGEMDIRRLTLQEINFIGCYTYSMADFNAALQAIIQGKLGKLDWTEQRPLVEGARAFADLSQAKVNAAKVILRP